MEKHSVLSSIQDVAHFTLFALFFHTSKLCHLCCQSLAAAGWPLKEEAVALINILDELTIANIVNVETMFACEAGNLNPVRATLCPPVARPGGVNPIRSFSNHSDPFKASKQH